MYIVKSMEVIKVFAQLPYMEVLDSVVHVAASILTLAALIALIWPKNRKWLIEKLTSEEKAKKKEEDRIINEKRIEVLEEKQVMFNSIILVLLHDRLFQSCLLNIERGYTTIPDLENIDDIYKLYKKNGGNGTGTSLYETVHKLEIKGDIIEKK